MDEFLFAAAKTPQATLAFIVMLLSLSVTYPLWLTMRNRWPYDILTILWVLHIDLFYVAQYLARLLLNYTVGQPPLTEYFTLWSVSIRGHALVSIWIMVLLEWRRRRKGEPSGLGPAKGLEKNQEEAILILVKRVYEEVEATSKDVAHGEPRLGSSPPSG